MKKFLVITLTLLSLVWAQAWDFEVGREFTINPERQAWYVLARYNLPLTSEVLGAQLWLLPEVGVFVPDGMPYYGYGRMQLLLDQTYGTLFVDAKTDMRNARLRIGLRFGWPP